MQVVDGSHNHMVIQIQYQCNRLENFTWFCQYFFMFVIIQYILISNTSFSVSCVK